MSGLRQKRIQLIQEIIQKDPTRYGYLNYQPFATNISGKYQVYPNDFLESLYQSIVQFENYHPEVFQDDSVWGGKYKEFLNEYTNCYNVLLQIQMQQYQQQQEYYALMAQQQQQAYQNYPQNQQQYMQQPQQQYGQQYPQQAQQQYGQNQQYYQKQQYGQNQQAGQQGGYQGYQQRGYQHRQQNYNQQGQQGVDQSQQQQNRYQQNRQNRYQQNRQNQQYGGQQAEGTYHQGYRQHGYHQQGHHQRHYPQQQPQPLETLEETVIEQKTVVPPPPPPKPEPQPKKFSLTQIRSFISSWSDKDKELVSKELIEKVNEVNGWTKGETSFDEKPQKPQQQRKYDNKRQRGDRQQRDKQQQGFVTGSKYKPEEPPRDLQLQRKDTGLKIVVGKNQTLEAKMIKKEIKEKAGQDFATLMEKENENLDQLAITKKEIIYNLNLLAPQNLKDIQKDLTQYLFADRIVCEVLIEQIIEKAWGQPKYASTYAKLCSQFSKVAGDKFSFQSSKEKKSEKKENPFKVFLISKVQHSFDKKLEQVPEFQNEEEKDNWLRETKKKILGNVKFIAELIRSKVLKKRIMKICISQLIFTFLAKYYYFRKSGKIIDSYYDYYFEALIEFIENVGQFYEKMDEASEKKEEKPDPYEPAEKKIIDLIQMNQRPPEEEIEEITNLKAGDYFKIFNLIDQRVLRKNNTRLSALLLNLTERRANNWQKHHSEADGPKKLKEIKEDIAKEEVQMNKVKQQKKESMEHLHDLVKAMYKDWQGGEKNEKAHFKNILKEYKEVEFLTECFNQVADDKKENITKRISLFDVILENYFNLEILKSAWFECVKYMAFSSGDFPFIPSAVALILKKIFAKDGTKLKEFFMKTEDEDEEFFINDVYGRLYHYSGIEEIKELTQPSKKYGSQLDA